MKISAVLFIVGLCSGSPAHADTETIKLLCELDVSTKLPFGEPTKSHETAGVEITYDLSTGFRSIVIDSLTIGVAVANSKGGAITSYTDSSDDGKWYISSDRKSDRRLSYQMVSIDRNTGRLMAYDISTIGGADMRTQATGICDKTDTSKRRF